jgi:putative ABC transport system substrate-binding protein
VQLIPTEELFDWTRALFPGAKQVGALYNPSEANSAKEVIDLEGILDKRNMELVKMAVYSTGEVPEAILGLLAKNVDLVFAMGDNTVANAMPAMVRACRQNGVPIIAEDIALMGTGAVLSCAPGPYSDGRELAGLTARILAGTSPEEIAIKPGKKNQLTIDMTALKKAGARSAPYNLLKRADVFFHLREKHEAPAEIIIVNLVENASLGEAINGVKDSFSEMGLRPKDDYTIKEYCAQGDMTQLAPLAGDNA